MNNDERNLWKLLVLLRVLWNLLEFDKWASGPLGQAGLSVNAT